MDSKAASSRNRKMAAATMDSCCRQRKGNPCPARSDAEAMSVPPDFTCRTIRQDGVYRSAPLEYHVTGVISEFSIFI